MGASGWAILAAVIHKTSKNSSAMRSCRPRGVPAPSSWRKTSARLQAAACSNSFFCTFIFPGYALPAPLRFRQKSASHRPAGKQFLPSPQTPFGRGCWSQVHCPFHLPAHNLGKLFKGSHLPANTSLGLFGGKRGQLPLLGASARPSAAACARSSHDPAGQRLGLGYFGPFSSSFGSFLNRGFHLNLP